jgi:hypothetical protein
MAKHLEMTEASVISRFDVIYTKAVPNLYVLIVENVTASEQRRYSLKPADVGLGDGMTALLVIAAPSRIPAYDISRTCRNQAK